MTPAREGRAPAWRRRLRLARALLGLVLAVPAAGAPTVIVLSWDGVRHDQPDRGELPAMARMQREGARAERLVPPFPSTTFPSHVSMATGTYPDRHGIVGNQFLDRSRGLFDYAGDASWIEAEPLWAAAERQGVRSAVLFWVGSETDWHGRGASDRLVPFDPSLGEAAKVDQILAWLDRPEPQRPHLVLSWWHGEDEVAHREGPDHPDTLRRLREQDVQLARLLAGLDARGAWADTTLLVVSDHGMAAAGEAVDAQAALDAAGVAARVLPQGGCAFVYLADPASGAAARRVLAALPGVAAFDQDELPAAWRIRHASRSGDLVLVTEPPRRFARAPGWRGRALAALAPLAGWRVGVHGYDPARPDMGGIFLALGRGVPAGQRLPPVRAVDVAPTAAALLGIDPPAQSEGTAVLGQPAP